MSIIDQHSITKLDIKIRNFEESDYPDIARINNIVLPDYPISANEFKEMDQHRHKKCKHRRWVATYKNKIIGTGLYTQYSFQYHPRKFNIWIIVRPELQNRKVGAALYDHIYKHLMEFEPISIFTEAKEDMSRTISFLKSREFKEFQRYSDSELEIEKVDLSSFENMKAKSNMKDIEIKTLKKLESDPDRNRKMYDLDQTVALDMPDEEGFTKVDYDTYVKRGIEGSYILQDGYFVAIHKNQYVGVSNLMRPEGDVNLWTGLTGVRREYRRRGIATHLKIRAIEYAKKQEAPLIKTDNQSGNKPMLNLNKKLGFKKRLDWICFRRDFKNK